jgi:hypothetical protein
MIASYRRASVLALEEGCKLPRTWFLKEQIIFCLQG